MALNVFFFADETMHKMYLDYGKYNFIQQIPQIIISTTVSQLLEVFLCFLSLTDKYFYEIKEIKIKSINKILQILRCIQFKVSLFFLFTGLMFLLIIPHILIEYLDLFLILLKFVFFLE